MIHLVLICGGQSPEHEISVRSSKNILQALDRSKYKVSIIGISVSGSWYLLNEESIGDRVEDTGEKVTIVPGGKNCFIANEPLGEVDVIFPVLHGPNGEDGTVQGLFELLGVPYVGPGVLGSSISMDKDTSKRLLKQAEVPVANWVTIRKGDPVPAFNDMINQLGEVLFVKPSNMGSSVGVSRVDKEEEWDKAIEEAFRHDNKVLIEVGLVGRELECAVLGNNEPEASGVGEVKSGEVYSYDEKYADTSSAEVIIPADVSHAELESLIKTAISAYKILNCKGLSRVDMFLLEDGTVVVNEVNTIPGFTNISMYPKLWQDAGLGYSELLDQLIQLAME